MFIANSISDKKERKRLLDGIDASLTDINKAVYLEKLGEHKDAEAKIEAAGKRFFEINEKLREGTLKKAELKNAMDRTMATLISEEARATARLQMDKALKYMEVNKATDFMNQVSMRVEGMVAKGALRNADTVNTAMIEILELTKGTDAKMMSALAALTGAAAAQTNAATNQQKAATDLAEARGKTRKLFRSDLLTTEMKPENEASISAARKADKDAGLKITDPNSQERKVRRGIEADLLATPAYKDLLSSDVTNIPDVVTAKPAPKKEDKKGAAPPSGFKLD